MAKIAFRRVKLSPANKQRLEVINTIVEEYQAQDLVLSLRQLYYQLVSRDIIPNQQKEYSKLSTLLKEGRMGGIVDWDAIEDRLRQPYTPIQFRDTAHGMKTLVNAYARERMKGQENYLEVWVEKDALSGVLKRVTSRYHVPILVNRGYSSASAMFDSYNRFRKAIDANQSCTILYLGDFDPSGVDMIRDIESRIREFLVKDYVSDVEEEGDSERLSVEERSERFSEWFREKFRIIAIALTKAQINRYNPPPNPAKRTDPRAKKFIREHGATSYEVDALRPEVLNDIVDKAILSRIDVDVFNAVIEAEKKDVAYLNSLIKKMK